MKFLVIIFFLSHLIEIYCCFTAVIKQTNKQTNKKISNQRNITSIKLPVFQFISLKYNKSNQKFPLEKKIHTNKQTCVPFYSVQQDQQQRQQHQQYLHYRLLHHFSSPPSAMPLTHLSVPPSVTPSPPPAPMVSSSQEAPSSPNSESSSRPSNNPH